MKKEFKKKLVDKGWLNREIVKAERILEKNDKHDVFFSKIVFWSALVVIIFANLTVSLILIPFLIVFQKWILYSIVVILAGSVGFLYNLLINDIGHLESKHHILASVLIPLLATANVVIMVIVSNSLIKNVKSITQQHNPWMVSIIFAVAFITPYLIERLRGK
jgi:hypothetical protein